MSKVIAQLCISLDGCYAGPRDDEPNWFKSVEAPGFFRITRWVTESMAWRGRQQLEGGETNVNDEVIAESFARPGAYVMGRRMFDGGERPWGEEPPFRNPVFVVTHRGARDARAPGRHELHVRHRRPRIPRSRRPRRPPARRTWPSRAAGR